MKIVADKRKWSAGRVSVVLLIMISLKSILNLVDAQMDSLVAPDHYDALSADVIRPAFRYHSSNPERITGKPKLGLGSAAISSVTEALSPILPFTGGLDLRREDYWTNGLFGSVSSIIEQVSDAFSSSVPAPSSDSFMGSGCCPSAGLGKSFGANSVQFTDLRGSVLLCGPLSGVSRSIINQRLTKVSASCKELIRSN
jgi:hypothetical protein